MKKKIKLIVILLVVVVAGGFGVMKFMGAEEGASPSATELAFVPLDPLFAPVMTGRDFTGYVLLMLQLELADARDLDKVNQNIAPLRDAFIFDLHLQALLRRKGDPPVNIRRVKERFLMIAERVIGPGVVTEVLIESAMERRG